MTETKTSSKSNLFWSFAVLILWLVALGATWYLFQKGPSDELKRFSIFVGRFHVILIHFPMGIVGLLALMELFALRKHGAHLHHSTRFVSWVATLGALASSWLGYVLMSGEHISGEWMTWHLWTGLGVGLACWVALFFKLVHLKVLSLLSLLGALGLTGAAGHYGGAMVHDGDYLAEYAPEPLKPLLGLTGGDSEKKTVQAASKPLPKRIVYTDIIAPMFEAKCVECHGDKKNEGELRLDSLAAMLKTGDSDNPGILPGKPDESEAVYRVELPKDDSDFMPTKNKPALTPDEIAVLKWWIVAGAPESKTVGDLKPEAAILDILKKLP